MADRITVRGNWLDACGKGKEDRTFDVLKTIPTISPQGSGFEVLYEVDCDGHTWIVAKCRLVKE